MQFYVFLSVTGSPSVLLVLRLMLGTMVGNGIFDRALDVRIDRLERSDVLQFGQIQRGLLVGSCRPNRNEPTIAGMTVLPVVLVLGAAAADDVQDEDEHTQNGADRDGYVERVEITVEVSFEVGIFQISVSFVYQR